MPKNVEAVAEDAPLAEVAHEVAHEDAPVAEVQPAPEVVTGPITVEAWCALKNTPAWLFAGLKVGNHWAVGKELTEAQYDAAVDAAHAITIS